MTPKSWWPTARAVCFLLFSQEAWAQSSLLGSACSQTQPSSMCLIFSWWQQSWKAAAVWGVLVSWGAVTNWHRLGGFQKQTLTLPQFWREGLQNQSLGRAMAFSGGPKGESIPCLCLCFWCLDYRWSLNVPSPLTCASSMSLYLCFPYKGPHISHEGPL